MKIAVTSTGKNLNDPVDPRFGRAAFILIVDSDTFSYETIDNTKNVNAFKGAGIQAATSISEKDAEVLLTGFCGPNAFSTLKAAGIKVVNDVTGVVGDAVKDFLSGKYPFAEEANTEGHW
jgi:predicted Fe-Mo cluster-binding NifX family protein